ncbi:hypothetical protein EOD42_16025 [Rhodovarius crocodyli]|uniref:Outer-membrane lipoprotein LolB n=1 Tax=Rhodovarius crocodyli TaxID=1979269 RepID=A0A437MDI0_9PROT|nr:hypothetical protein [Rhodovarius crocodyli]RVT95701.1 hypothetical protein EOD42_16025 [Rhodovarius crocodyli]
MKRRHGRAARAALICLALAACTAAPVPLPPLEPDALPASDDLMRRLIEAARPGGLSDRARSERLLGLRWVEALTPNGQPMLSARPGTRWLRYPDLPMQALLTVTPERTTLRLLMTTTGLCLSVEQVMRAVEGPGSWSEAWSEPQARMVTGWQVEPRTPDGTRWRFSIEGTDRAPAACISAITASQPTAGTAS